MTPTRASYDALKAKWRAGERDRELALQSMYAAWMHWADPPFVTGLNEEEQENAISLWLEIFEFFGAEASPDAEFLYVAAIMAYITPEEIGGTEEWGPRVERMNLRAASLNPAGFSPKMFEGRGDYGEYFAHQSRP